MTKLSQEPKEAPLDAQLTGHEYDGIVEYDNPMPGWWTRTFWATFVFSLGYFVHYQLTGNGATVADTYATDMREYREAQLAQSLGEVMTEAGLTQLMSDPALMKDARTVFVARCIQCHADRGQGNIGPNLTDDHWLYGAGSLMELHEIVANGRPQKGMPAWARLLRPLELAQVVAYVGTLRNTNVPGRPPQGTRLATGVEPRAPAPPAAGGG
jgi:cytochrome c oxidase cbb3-type subunit III